MFIPDGGLTPNRLTKAPAVQKRPQKSEPLSKGRRFLRRNVRISPPQLFTPHAGENRHPRANLFLPVVSRKNLPPPPPRGLSHLLLPLTLSHSVRPCVHHRLSPSVSSAPFCSIASRASSPPPLSVSIGLEVSPASRTLHPSACVASFMLSVVAARSCGIFAAHSVHAAAPHRRQIRPRSRRRARTRFLAFQLRACCVRAPVRPPCAPSLRPCALRPPHGQTKAPRRGRQRGTA